MACEIKMMGADYVIDTDFEAGLTIMEKAHEFLQRFSNGELKDMPMFTSCCPRWVRFLKAKYPEYVGQLSSEKFPHQMFGAIIKIYIAEKKNIDPSKLCVISIMPCVAKKHEIELPTMKSSGYEDVDVVLTTRKLDRMIRAEHIDVESLQDVLHDIPFNTASGAGVIFGARGGVMEAALRSAYYFLTCSNAAIETFYEVRGMNPCKEATYDINGATISTVIVCGLGDARTLIETTIRKELSYDFVDVRACPGGCSGGGQSIWDGVEMAQLRAPSLYQLDASATLRYSHENRNIQTLYHDFLEAPCSHQSEQLLHTDHNAWNMPSEK